MPAKSIQFFGRGCQGNRLLIYIHWVVAPVAVAMVDMVSATATIHKAGELACVAGEYTDLAEVACVADDLVGAADAEAAEIHDEGGHLDWGLLSGVPVLLGSWWRFNFIRVEYLSLVGAD